MKQALKRTMHFGARSNLRQLTASGLSRRDAEIISRVKEANRGVSRADFANKIGIIQKEAAETQYWIELLIDSGLGATRSSSTLLQESTELLAIFTASGKRLKVWQLISALSTLAFTLSTFHSPNNQ